MEGGLMEKLSEAIREALFEVVGDLLKTENFKINLEPGSKKGKKKKDKVLINGFIQWF